MKLEIKAKEYTILRRALETYYYYIINEESSEILLEDIIALEHKLIAESLDL